MYLKIEVFHFALYILEFFFYIVDLYFAMSYKGCSSRSYFVTLEIAFRNFKGFELLNRPFSIFFAMINVHDYRRNHRTIECPADCPRLGEIVGRWNVLVNYQGYSRIP